jgi:hypothetical protein
VVTAGCVGVGAGWWLVALLSHCELRVVLQWLQLQAGGGGWRPAGPVARRPPGLVRGSCWIAVCMWDQ